jgi:hypothetical protein
MVTAGLRFEASSDVPASAHGVAGEALSMLAVRGLQVFFCCSADFFSYCQKRPENRAFKA